jgi:hypothetical protein
MGIRNDRSFMLCDTYIVCGENVYIEVNEERE